MTDGEIDHENQPSGWVKPMLEAGLPGLLAGPAGKAISRLLGSAVNIPAAYLESASQSVRDKTEGRSIISNALAQAIAEKAVGDPDTLERAANSLLHRAYRTQQNKDEVARHAIAALKEQPPTDTSEGPAEDWMMKFERYAEEATTEDIQLMFGRLLAGEVRQRGAVSPATLHFVSMLDPISAQIIERVLPYSTDAQDGPVFLSCLDPELTHAELSRLERDGFWTTGKEFRVTIGSEGFSFQRARASEVFILEAKPGSVLSVPAAIISRAGQDVVSVVGRPFDFKGVAQMYGNSGATGFCVGGAASEAGQILIKERLQ